MGSFSDALAARLRQKQPKPAALNPDAERLMSAAIQRDGKVHFGGRSHYEVRQGLGDKNPQASNLNDVEGFMTSARRFVTREEAQAVAVDAGQIKGFQRRPLLSSDIEW